MAHCMLTAVGAHIRANVCKNQPPMLAFADTHTAVHLTIYSGLKLTSLASHAGTWFGGSVHGFQQFAKICGLYMIRVV